ncbi:MAG: [FeFe] hydrogenase H-cluster radical SAM maturase HydG [Deltaproteobacteria bacterium]|nr:[FeFe] hydrogenase H-cluster radical SAM maturase HydG [Deltaproteobacteria bacterium]
MIIDTGRIEDILKAARAEEGRVRATLEKAGEAKGLSIEEAACLLDIDGPALTEELLRKAGEVKEKVFGKRVVLFAPLYLSNHCTNGCLYCGFRSQNRGMERTALTPPEAADEAKALVEMGFKRVLLVTGEAPEYGLDYITACVRAVYENTGMRIVHVNAPPMDADGLAGLKASGVGVYQSFQETYHRPAYEKMHPTGRKKDYDYRLGVMDRALGAGFEDVGIGPLFGLHDHRFETLATIAHSMHLFERFGAHAHTISVPRLRPASGGLADVPAPVSDIDLKKIVAVFRLCLPSAGVVVSTRESARLRSELLAVGASQISAASRTNPGGYARAEKTLEQFSTNDTRSLNEVIASIAGDGLLPSLCTTCYRVGRTGSAFTEKTMAGEMERLCQANAVLTLKEYLCDHPGMMNGSSEAVKKALDDGIKGVTEPGLKKSLLEKLKEMEEGKRDLYF